jgi:hypothetical protein
MEDKLAPARGVINGALLGIVIWAIWIGVAAWVLLR